MSSPQRIFYTSDLHLGHANIIKLCNRPFSNAEEMNETLVSNWNCVVSKNDIVYVLGDVAFRAPFSMKPILKKLNGTKHLIVGNHDTAWVKNLNPLDYFVSVSNLLEVKDGETHITLCHYPMISWNRSMRGAVHIHGHIHNNLHDPFYALQNRAAYNAGVEVNDYKPATLEQLIENKRKFYTMYGLDTTIKSYDEGVSDDS